MNSTTLEIGQGLSGFRGYLWPACLAGIGVFAFGAIVLLMNHDSIEPEPLWLATLMLVICLASVLGFLFALVLFLNDLFGYADSPVRFDRARRKVYVWASRKEGPLELDWDKLKVVTQRATALPVQANAFKSVLLIDEDQNGDVCWQAAGYRVELIFLRLTQADEAVARVAQRVKQGGHDIPEPVIRRRFAAGLYNLTHHYAQAVDAWALYDNSGDEPVLQEWSER